MTDVDQKFIKRCFELAEEAKLRGDIAVGSVLVGMEGEVISEASERNRTSDTFSHAELLVIQQAIRHRQSDDLTDCALFTTNEPCFLCSFAIRTTGISRVVCVQRTLGIGGFSSNYPILSANDIEIWKAAPEIIFMEEN